MVLTGAGLALALGACQTDREVTKPEPEPVTEERLTAALLTLEDLPAGFTAADPTGIATEVLPEHECDDRLADLEAEGTVAADFAGDGATLSSSVAWFPGQGGSVDQLFRDIGADCRQVVASDQGVSVRTAPLDFGVLSDDTLAIRFEVESSTGPIIERDVILMRDGDLIHVVRLTGPRPSDKGLLDSTVRVALGRLGRLAQETT